MKTNHFTLNTAIITNFILISLLFIKISKSELNCTCTMDGKDFGSVKPTVTQTPEELTQNLVLISPEDHMVKGQNIGKIFAIGDRLYTQNNYTVRMSTKDLSLIDGEACPIGWEKMNLEDLENISTKVNAKNIGSVMDPQKMNFVAKEDFFSTHRTIPDGTGLDAYRYKAVRLYDDDINMEIIQRTTGLIGSIKRTKCVLRSKHEATGFKLKEDLISKMKYLEDITMSNVIDYEVEFSGGVKHSGSAKFKFCVKSPGCSVFKKKWKMFDGTILTECDARFVRQNFGTDKETTLAKEDLTKVVYDGVHASREIGLHFSAGTAPIAPLPEGGAYILYKEMNTNALKVIHVDNQMQRLKEIDLKITAKPMAIVGGAYGMVVYVRSNTDPNHSWLAAYSAQGDLQWKQTIVNNGNEPNEPKDQIDFFDENSKRLFGMEAMYKPHNGQLVEGRGRIFLIFTHYNNFNAGKGSLDGHSGDCMISFDYSGKGWMMGSSWATSHSLVQRALYDGRQFYTSSLGDAFPLQIQFVSSDAKYANLKVDGVSGLKNRFDFVKKDNIIDGLIPGANGNSCGRLGGLSMFNAVGFKLFAQVYSRKACTVASYNVEKTNDKNEIGLVTFDRSLNKLAQYKIGEGGDVNSVFSAKYGSNIVVLYSRSPPSKTTLVYNPAIIQYDKDKTFMMLVGTDGNVKTAEFQLDENFISNDGMVVLSDGNVAWTVVDDQGSLISFRLKTPDKNSVDEIVPLPESSNIINTSTGNTLVDSGVVTGDSKNVQEDGTIVISPDMPSDVANKDIPLVETNKTIILGSLWMLLMVVSTQLFEIF